MNHLKKYWGWYLGAAIAVGYVITSLVKNEWNPMNWGLIASPGGTRTKGYTQCINGTLYISGCASGCPSAAVGPCSSN